MRKTEPSHIDPTRLTRGLRRRPLRGNITPMRPTPRGLDALDTFDVPATLDTIRPEESTVFDDFTRLLW